MFGYGSPQIAQFTASICNLFNAEGVVLQPLFPSRAFVKNYFREFELVTVSTSVHPYIFIGRREYIERCVKEINKFKPDILIISHYILFDILDGLTFRPKKVIHLVLEDIAPILESSFGDIRLSIIKRQSIKVDIWVFPEANRAMADSILFGIQASSIFILYNCSSKNGAQALNSTERNGKVVYAGTLDKAISVAKYIFDEDLSSIPIDVYGDLQGDRFSKETMKSKISQPRKRGRPSHVRWFGQIPGSTLDDLLPRYSYSLVFWLPVRHALLNAAPNKFFQAISAGVPVISAPHPQTKMLIERYGCGILLDGWEKTDLLKGLNRALKLSNANFSEIVDNCLEAASRELSWEHQITKFAKFFQL